MKLTALKPFRYATRALRTGDVFDAGRRDARVLMGIGKARRYVPTPVVEPTLDELRLRAADLGIEVDHRWRERRLQEEIAESEERGDPETETETDD